MIYYNVEPVADAEIENSSLIDFGLKPRKIIRLKVFLFSYPESDLIQAYPAFLVSAKLKKSIEEANLTGGIFLPCSVIKSDQYDELSEFTELPEMWCLEPVGKVGDDFIFHSGTQITASKRFMDILARHSSIGCVFHECEI
jgi:hypothetical protein